MRKRWVGVGARRRERGRANVVTRGSFHVKTRYRETKLGPPLRLRLLRFRLRRLAVYASSASQVRLPRRDAVPRDGSDGVSRLRVERFVSEFFRRANHPVRSHHRRRGVVTLVVVVASQIAERG